MDVTKNLIKEFLSDSGGPGGPPSRSGVYGVGIYSFYNKKRRIVYIGSSINMRKRLMNPSHPYRKLFSRINYDDGLVYTITYETEHYKEYEKILIRHFKPLLNKQIKNG